jgi:hypothetical protein
MTWESLYFARVFPPSGELVAPTAGIADGPTITLPPINAEWFSLIVGAIYAALGHPAAWSGDETAQGDAVRELESWLASAEEGTMIRDIRLNAGTIEKTTDGTTWQTVANLGQIVNTATVTAATSAAAATIQSKRSRTGPSALQSGDNLLFFDAQGHNGTDYVTGGRIRFITTQAWTGAANGTELQIAVVPAGGTSLLNAIRIDGASGAVRMGLWGAAPVARPTVTGSRAGNVALANLLTALASAGHITNNTTT